MSQQATTALSTTEGNEASPPSTSPTSTLSPPPGFDLPTVYTALVAASHAVTTVENKVEMQARNSLRVALRMDNIEKRMLSIERDRIVG